VISTRYLWPGYRFARGLLLSGRVEAEAVGQGGASGVELGDECIVAATHAAADQPVLGVPPVVLQGASARITSDGSHQQQSDRG
jgi:hypothetical protein